MNEKVTKLPERKSANGFKCHFMLEKETKGALKFTQVLGPGSSIVFTQPDGHEIGVLYVRKSAFKDGVFPKHITISVSVATEPTKPAAE